MESVVVGGPGLVAVGNDISEAAVWTSPDGVTWTRLPHEAGVFGGPGKQSMWSVTVGGPGLVAVGSDVANAESWDAAVWTSADGVSWTRVAHDEEVFGGGFMRSVTTGGPGLVAVGRATTFYDRGSESDAAVWTSRDGVPWTRVTHDEGVFGGGGNQGMRSVVVGGPGLVAVGSDNLTLGTGDLPVYPSATVWTSPDGVTWTRVPHDENVFGGPGYQQMRSVAVGGPGLVAVGSDDGTVSRAQPYGPPPTA